jgi:hypothetical protein
MRNKQPKDLAKIFAELLAPREPVDVSLRSPLPPAVYQFKAHIRHVKPPVWRRIQVPNDLTLLGFHHVMQSSFGWYNCHLHQFHIQGTSYGMCDPDLDMDGVLDERHYQLCDFALRKGTKWRYDYDFGDGWEHELLLEKILPWEDGFVPTCIGGARACPIEDSGGAWGYMEKLEIIRDPKHEEYEETREWMGSRFDPEDFDVKSVNAALHSEFAPKRRSRRRKS